MPDFIPRKQADFLAWSGNFLQMVSASPVEFGLTEQLVAQYAVLHAQLVEAMRAAVDPSTRGPATVLAKDIAMDAAKEFLRKLCRMSRGSIVVGREQRQLLGLKLGDRTRRRIPVPAEAPRVRADGLRGKLVTIYLRDASSPTRTGIPKDVRSAMIYSYIGDEPPISLEQWRYHGQTGRAKSAIEFDASVPDGAKVWISAIWLNARGEAGPGSQPVYTHLGFGMMRMSA